MRTTDTTPRRRPRAASRGVTTAARDGTRVSDRGARTPPRRARRRRPRRGADDPPGRVVVATRGRTPARTGPDPAHAPRRGGRQTVAGVGSHPGAVQRPVSGGARPGFAGSAAGSARGGSPLGDAATPPPPVSASRRRRRRGHTHELEAEHARARLRVEAILDEHREEADRRGPSSWRRRRGGGVRGARAEATRRARGKSWTSSRRRTRGRRVRSPSCRRRSKRASGSWMRAWRRSESAAAPRGGARRDGGDKGVRRARRGAHSKARAATRKHLAADAFDAERSVDRRHRRPRSEEASPRPNARGMAARNGKTSVERPDYSARARGAVARDAHSQGRRRPRGARGCAASLTAAKAEAALREMMEGQVEKARAESAAKARAREEVER